MAKLENRFSWSKSRNERLENCPRQYFYNYYGSWGGWERDAPPEARELYLLKKLSNRFAWSGIRAHDAIRLVLEGVRFGREPDSGELLDRVRTAMRAEFRESRDKSYRQRKAFGLLEHEYEEEVSREEWRRAWDQVERSLLAFYNSRWLEIARSLEPAQWLPIDELATFQWGETPIYAAPDFAFREGDGIVLVDWKTGRPRPSDREQLLGYALFAQETWEVPAEEVLGQIVYLPSMQEEEVMAGEGELAAFTGRMEASIAKMRSLLSDPENNVAEIENFPKAEDERACRFCAFRRPCRGIGA